MGTQAGPLDGHVVIIDDDASLRRSLSNLLGSVGFHVETFVSAEAFLESDHREQARCLVVDLRMPGMTGLDLLRHLAAIGSSVPAIVLTAHDNDEARRECLEAGAFAFLEKPFRSATLLDAVRRALVARAGRGRQSRPPGQWTWAPCHDGGAAGGLRRRRRPVGLRRTAATYHVGGTRRGGLSDRSGVAGGPLPPSRAELPPPHPNTAGRGRT